jgi:hypothetical protein
MLTESARMSSAAEARFRINAPNSKPRNIKVIALDRPSEGLVKRLAQLHWNGASFFTASAFAPRSPSSAQDDVHDASAPSPRLRGEGRGEGASPQAQTRGEAPSPGLSPHAGRGEAGPGHFSMQGWLSDLAGRTKDLLDEVDHADLIVMVATAGEDAAAATLIGEACSLKRVNTTGLILGGRTATDEMLSKTLSRLRPWSLMLVIASGEDYIEDMLIALRA